ncbi:hypothetical protein GCM10007171_24160 [Dickeya fangzhongdai]|nr:hypothetical protein GCM10007171_24160 [Dickeya fangzhongdai]
MNKKQSFERKQFYWVIKTAERWKPPEKGGSGVNNRRRASLGAPPVRKNAGVNA